MRDLPEVPPPTGRDERRGNLGLRVRGQDDPAHVEQVVVRRLGVVEGRLGIRAQRQRPQREPELVDVGVEQVRVAGHGPDRDRLAAVAGRAGIHPASAVGRGLMRQRLEALAVGPVQGPLLVDPVRAFGVEVRDERPGRREHEQADDRDRSRDGERADPRSPFVHAREMPWVSHDAPRPASRSPPRCTPMMNRCSSRSWLPGSRLTTTLIVSRPHSSTTDTAKNVRIARARSSRRKRRPQRTAPTATSNEKMGKRARSCVVPDPSNSLPVNSHSTTFLPPYESNQNVPTLYCVRSAHLLSSSNGTITHDAQSAPPILIASRPVRCAEGSTAVGAAPRCRGR